MRAPLIAVLAAIILVGGNPHTGIFDGVVGVSVDYWLAFDVAGEDRTTASGGSPQLNLTTGPLHVTFRGGPDGPLRTLVQPSLEGRTTVLTLTHNVGSGAVRLEDLAIHGASSAEFFGFTMAGVDTTLGHGSDDYPVLGPIPARATVANLGRFEDPTPGVTDLASGEGSLALD